ncbi:hypothetical protein RFI_36551 [Reticulomyxa filosa]|uniref:Uncharacterized protein n=1 Tax=Reticulomyxa filosa TaxID=46433 RepID=X6LH44_RETFI|nr:hypothetical protein RFI_36551 [Reticulomyxa filosa]|eukprot:ETO00889.1 hypothetical protein RFI_36551 [Reticulomyxa filosa]
MGLKVGKCHVKVDKCDAKNADACELCFSASFFILLIHLDTIVFALINIFAFDVNDFVRWGTETLPHPNIYKYKQHINYDNIHDLFNYRNALGPHLLYGEGPLEDPNNLKPPLNEASPVVASQLQPLDENTPSKAKNENKNNNTEVGLQNKPWTSEPVTSSQEKTLKIQQASPNAASLKSRGNTTSIDHNLETEMTEKQKNIAALIAFPEEIEP